MFILKVIVPIGQVPERAIVTKKNGNKAYVVRNQIDVFNESGGRETIKTQGCRYLVDASSGNANAYGEHIEVVWRVAEYEIDHLMTMLNLDPEDH